MTEVTVETSLACKLKNAVLIIRTVVSLLLTRLLKLSLFARVFCDLKVAKCSDKKKMRVLLCLSIGQYKMQTADCRLQTADRVQNAD